MPRAVLTKPRKNVTFRIEEGLNAKYDILLQDPTKERSAYGKKSQIVETLLQRLLIAIKRDDDIINVHDLVNLVRRSG